MGARGENHVTIVNGKVDVTNLSATLKVAQPELKHVGAPKPFNFAADIVDGLNNLPFYDFFVSMNNIGTRHHTKSTNILARLFRQILWGFPT